MGKPHKHTDLIKAWADGAEIQCHYEDYGWIDTSYPQWWEFNNYRIKPKEQKKLNIPWELIKPEFTQAAMDENGEVFVFTQEEISFIATGRYWCFNDLYVGKHTIISESLTIDTDGIDWKESLTLRPEGEQQ